MGVLLIAGGIVLTILSANRPGHVLSPGKPPEEPRDLIAWAKWRALIPDLAGKAEDLKRDVKAELLSGKVDETIRMAEERIGYWGLDGKEEREQLTAIFRRGIASLLVYPYDKDLFVSWETYLNVGTWAEEEVATGIDVVTGKFTRVMTIKPTRQVPNEYEIADLDCLTEWVHNAMVKVVKRYKKDYKIDKRFDFQIIREKDEVKASGSDKDRSDESPRRSRFSFQRRS
jgi:hypothetical protein